MKTFKSLLCGLALLLIVGCAAVGPKHVWHSFEADGALDRWGQQVQLLEYRYENGVAMAQRKAGQGGLEFGSSISITGDMPVADYLYLKWRTKSTGEVHEKSIHLRPLLPENMLDHKITFVIEGDQVYVYLVTPKGKSERDPPLLKTYLSKYYVSYEIYPNRTAH